MKIVNIIAFLFIAATSIAVSAQTKFTSTYTNLGAGCQVLRGGDGQDDAKLCKGPAGYQVRVYSSAMATHIVAELKGSDKNFPLATVSLGFNESKAKVEWRHANGKPFAAILRVPTYGEAPPDGGLGKPKGEELVIQGLSGYERIGAAVDAKRTGSNLAARKVADDMFLGKD